MLDGLEATELKISEARSNPDFRIDAEFHRKPIAENRSYEYMPVGGILKLIQYGISIDMNEEGDGYKIYRMNEITNMLCNVDVIKYADITQGEAAAFTLDNNDVLFNRTNSQEFVGRTGIFKKFSDEPHVFASYLIRLRTDETKVLPEYLTTFFNSKFGLWDIKRRARISINQSNVNAEEIKAIKIPIIGDGIQQYIRKLFDSAFAKVLSSRAMYAEAESLLLEELGLKDWQPSGETIAVKSFSESFGSRGRIDAEYYHPDKQRVLDGLAKMDGMTVNEHFISVNETLNPMLLKSDELVQNYDLDDALQFFIDEKESISASELGSTKVRFQKDDVVVSRLRSYLKEIAVVDTPKTANCVGSSEFIVLRPRSDHVNSELLLVYLRSLPIQQILKWCQSGSNHPRFAEEDLLSIKIPNHLLAIQQEIKKTIRTSIESSRKSKSLLEIAKRGVEIAIEQDEAAALVWMDEQTRLMHLS